MAVVAAVTVVVVMGGVLVDLRLGRGDDLMPGVLAGPRSRET